MNKDNFTLTKDHVTLIRNMYVGWGEYDHGAPTINQKRPYGNSGVWDDIAFRLLNWKDLTKLSEADEDDFYKSSEYTDYMERAEKIHEETDQALQIVLSSGSFEPGKYVCNNYNDWTLVEE